MSSGYQIIPDPTFIEVGENSLITLNYRLVDAFGDTVDITGDAFYLTVKRAITDADALAWVNFAGVIVTAAEGKFKFDLTPAHTALPPGDWPAELRWWSSGTITEPPEWRRAVTYRVTPRLYQP